MFARNILLQMANSKRAEAFVRSNRMATGTRSRFIAGETVESITVPVQALNTQGISATLDYLGESVYTREEVARTLQVHNELFTHIQNKKLNANVSVKLTALGLDIDTNFCFDTMVEMLKAAGPGQFVRIDMESSAYTQATLDLFYRLWNEAGFRNVGIVIQAYLHRSSEDIEGLIQNGVRVRLCKGAYKEPATVAFPDKSEVDANYVRLMQRLLKDGNYPGIATHDPAMIEETRNYADQENIPADRFEFQMLFGIRRDLQIALREKNYPVRVYTPFGTHWYPYFMRRLAERPANLWFILKNAAK